MKRAIQFMLRAYKRVVSPMLPAACRYVPTCSEYALEAVERHGVVRGSSLAAWRVLRCHPFANSGYDPVPTNLFTAEYAEDAEEAQGPSTARQNRPRSARDDKIFVT